MQVKPKTAKFFSKLAFGAAVSFVIGEIIKAEHRTEDKIDEHFDKKAEQTDA